MKSKKEINIGPQVKEVMDDFTWLESVKKDDEINRFKGTDLITGQRVERCMVCTLPLGSCEHTADWRIETLANRMIDPSELDLENTLDVLGDNTRPANTQLLIDMDTDVDLEHLCWEVFDDRPVDRIGEAKVHLFTPFARFWHTTTYIGNLLITFGGLCVRKEKVYQDIRQIEDSNDFDILNDIRIYNIAKQSWHGVRAEGVDKSKEGEEMLKFPPPRYGHVAAAFDDRTLIIFGGRGANNMIYGDTWLYDIIDDIWREVQSITYFGERIMPEPRFHSSMTAIKQRNEVYLFGGTNEQDNFADLWVFRKSDMLWERIITVGFAPAARYGHVLLPIERQQTLIVIGGCTVNPHEEWEASQLPEEVSIAQMHRKYQSLLDQQFVRLNKKLRGLSTTDYRIAEEKLFESWQNAKSMSYYLKKTVKHTNPHIDIYFYNLQDQMWIDRKFPKFTGELPKSRMYFGAQAIGHFLFVVGGAYPTSLFMKSVDQNGQRNVDINVLDLRTHTWTKPLPINSDEYYKQTMLIAEADIIRAQKRLQAERLEGLSLGAPEGLTREVAVAQAMLNVCIWRKRQLETKTKEDFLSPNPIIAASFTAVRQRLVLVGGFTPGIGYRQDVLALSVEHIYERERRLEELYYAKLELDRKEAEAKAAMEDLITAYELRAAILEERRRRERELREMAMQDYLSSLPPLALPNPVKLVKVNHSTIWVEWDRLTEDSSGNIVDPKDIIYFLYMKSSIETLRENDEVLIVQDNSSSAITRKRIQRPYSRGELYRGPKEGYYFTEFCYRFPGIIRKVKGKGLFDVLYDDGSYEANVPRYRIKLNKQLDALDSNTNPAAGLTIQTNLSISHDTAGNTSRGIAFTPKKITSPKKLKILQRLSSYRIVPKGNKLRKLHESKSHPMPLQGTVLLQYPGLSFSSLSSVHGSSLPPTARTADHSVNKQTILNPLLADGDDISTEVESLHSHTEFHFPSPSSYQSQNNQYVEEVKAITEQPTVKVDPDWQLIYVGNDNYYSCSHLIPQALFDSEPGIQAAVMFAIQVQGIDFPRYERSRLSKPMIYYTVNPVHELNDSLAPSSPMKQKESAKSNNAKNAVTGNNSKDDDTMGSSNFGGISKTKKEIITAVVKDQQIIQIEKRGYYTYGEGIGDHYD